jgi:hypothetical protein
LGKIQTIQIRGDRIAIYDLDIIVKMWNDGISIGRETEAGDEIEIVIEID